LKDLPDAWKKTFDKYGINEVDWDVMRKSLTEHEGINYIDSDKLYASNREAGAKFIAMLHEETRIAIPEPGIEVRAITTQGAALGSYERESISYLTGLKSFTLVSTLNTLRGIGLDNRVLNRKTMAIKHLAFTSIMGAVGVQAMQIASGKDLMDINSTEFLVRATLKGGGFGALGDLSEMFSGDKEKMALTIAGPGLAFLFETFEMLHDGAVVASNTGDKDFDKKLDKFLGKLARFSKKITPGTNLWYAKLAAERFFWDQLEMAANPGANKSYKRYEKRLQKRTGQNLWWPKGTKSPERAPRIADDSDK
jgi:hypothetical protein